METKDFIELDIFRQKLNEFKKANNLTLNKIGEATGVDKSHVQRILTGENSPSFLFVLNAAKFMGIPLFALFFPTDEVQRLNFAEKIEARLEELKISIEGFASKTSIPILRAKDISRGKTSPTEEEFNSIVTVLGLEGETNLRETNIHYIKSLLGRVGLDNDHIENILEYIRDNIK